MENNLQIKNRMIKKAAALWGVTPNEIESTFDPIVSLLLNACSSEISKIASDIKDSETKVTERLIQLMTPENVHGVRPAHAIAYAEPVGANSIIGPEDLFFYKKDASKTHIVSENQNIFFSPVKQSNLINAKIVYLICGNEGYEVNGNLKTDIALNLKNKNRQLPASTLYLGIKTEEKKITLKDTSLFFKFLDVVDEELFYFNIKQSQLYYKETKLNITPGFSESFHTDKDLIESVFSNDPQKIQTIENQIGNIYKKHFLTIRSDVSLEDEPDLPEEFHDLVDLETHVDFEELHWIKITFPKVIGNKLLNKLFCSFNAMPVLNRKIENITYQLKDFIHIVPIKTNDLFLDIKQIVNTSGKEYRFRENDISKDQKGTFIIRGDNNSKLDTRKAKEYLAHLIELLKDESSSFSVFGGDFLQSKLKELNQNIATLENKLSNVDKQDEDINHVYIKPYKKKDTLLISYWTTNGEEANGIKSGTSLHTYKGTKLKNKTSYFLTPTFEGKNYLKTEERLYAYRSALLSRQRIVSKEDIKALCFQIGGSKIEKVSITKSFMTSLDQTKGLTPTIEINIYPTESHEVSKEEWGFIKTTILSALEKRAINVYPFYIKIKGF